jgi:hypothetical protein
MPPASVSACAAAPWTKPRVSLAGINEPSTGSFAWAVPANLLPGNTSVSLINGQNMTPIFSISGGMVLCRIASRGGVAVILGAPVGDIGGVYGDCIVYNPDHGSSLSRSPTSAS